MVVTEKRKNNRQQVICNIKRICVGSKHKGRYVNVDDILYLEAYENYSWLHLKNGNRILSCKAIKYYEDEFHVHGFARIHRSYLVNLSCIKKYEKKYRLLYLEKGVMLSVSYRRNNSFAKMIAVEPSK